MFGILKEFSLLNLVFSPIISFIVVFFGVYLGIESYNNQKAIAALLNFSLPPLLVIGLAWFLLGVFFFILRKYSSWIGRLGNVFIIAGILDIGIAMVYLFF